MLAKRLSIVSLYTRDFEASVKFYEGLGWTPDVSLEGFAVINLGGAPLAIAVLDHLAADLGTEAAELEDGGRYGRYVPGVLVDTAGEVDGLFEIVKNAGGRILTNPATQPWGVRNFYFTDPEGSLWEVAHVPNLTFGVQDAAIWPVP
ncbi:MAG TPA: VOC family protein [Amycolatopsis sp.]|uniref:VOC family protein n=1 Tax=Amycolatopsis sp. TaxID=37632 RepID=UPI002B464331|nr:VOC family protein [Amycolatopsis sp.]HKS47488.1 VOC family protein [Amycolatopsis sp.]